MSGFCPKCGKPAGDGTIFCSSCGYKFGTPVQNGADQPQQPYAQPQQPYAQPQQPYAQPQQPYTQTPLQYQQPRPQKKGMLLIVLSIVFFVLAAGVVTAIFLLGPYNAEPKILNGEWDCVLKVEKIFNEDTSYINKSDLGDEKDTQLKLDLDKYGEGEMVINGITFNAAYKDGKITAESMLDDKLQFSLDGMLKKGKEGLTFTGTWKYTIMKGTDKGGVASGSWMAVLVEPDEEPSATKSSLPGAKATQSAPLQTAVPAGISLADLEGAWIGDLALEEIPGMEQNPNIPESDKAIMRSEIGTKSEKVFIFKNGKLWVGEESDSTDIADVDMGTVTISGTSFNADVTTVIGKANITGNLINEGGTAKIKCSLVFPEIPTPSSTAITVTIKASFTGVKQK